MEPIEIVLWSVLGVSAVLMAAIRIFRLVPRTRLAAAALSGAKVLRVSDVSGFAPGQVLIVSFKRRKELAAVTAVGADGDLTLADGLSREYPERAVVARASGFQETVDTVFWALCLAFLIRGIFVQAFKIPSPSMESTLLVGDHLLVAKLPYGIHVLGTDTVLFRFRTPKRGDVIVFKFPGEDPKSTHHGTDFIKRCIGVAGDMVEMRDKVVYVNGVAQDETYKQLADFRILSRENGPDCMNVQYSDPKHVGPAALPGNSRDNWGPYQVPEGTFFPLGDNRDRSFDGRCWGPVPLDNVRGKAIFRYYPLRRIGFLPPAQPGS